MRPAVFILLLALSSYASAQNVAAHFNAGREYCHEVNLGGSWTVERGLDEETLRYFRDSQGELEYRMGPQGSILVSFYAGKYEAALKPDRVYSSRKTLFSLYGDGAPRNASQQEWDSAAFLRSSRVPNLSPAAGEVWQWEKPVRFRGFAFAGTRALYPPAYAASPGGDWIATLSWEGELPGEFDFVRPHGAMYIDVYGVGSGEKSIGIQLNFRGIEPDDIFPHVVWISDRHLLFPMNQRKTRLMVCDVRPLQKGSDVVWDRASAGGDILGIREESEVRDGAGTLGRLIVHTGVRVPVAGVYLIAMTLENEAGKTAKQFGAKGLPAGVNQIDVDVRAPRDVDGILKITSITLYAENGREKTELAHRENMGTIGPYKMIEPQGEARKHAVETFDRARLGGWKRPAPKAPSPLKMRSFPVAIENLSGIPKAGEILDHLRLKLAVPRVPGECSWSVVIESDGKFLARAIAPVSSPLPESVVFEFQDKHKYPPLPDGEVRLSTIRVSCHDETSWWTHKFDEFPGYVIPGLRVSMLRPTPPAVTFTGENRVEFLDTNHDGKYEAIKVVVGFRSDVKCKVSASPNGNGIAEALYDPKDHEEGIVFYVGYAWGSVSAEQFLGHFDAQCETPDGMNSPALYDRSARVPLGALDSKQFQSPFELSFESEQPALANGELSYTVNCTPRWTLDLPFEFTAYTDIPSAQVSLDPPRGSCKQHAATVRVRPPADAPPWPYNIGVSANIPNGAVQQRIYLQWLKPGVPEILGVLPRSGGGKRAQFRVTADDLSTRVQKTELLINTAPDIAHGCHVTITNLGIALTDDLGTSAAMNPKSPSVENSQCIVGQGVPIAVSFKPAFYGPKKIYARATNGAGVTSGWIEEGEWTVSQNERPVAISVQPYLAATDRQTVTFTVADPNGAGDVRDIEAVFALGLGDGRACRLVIDRASSTAALDNAGAGYCSVSGVHVEQHGRSVSVTAEVRFTPEFRGRRNIFLRASDLEGLESEWLWAGSWDVR